jgi:hypothetical protein
MVLSRIVAIEEMSKQINRESTFFKAGKFVRLQEPRNLSFFADLNGHTRFDYRFGLSIGEVLLNVMKIAILAPRRDLGGEFNPNGHVAANYVSWRAAPIENVESDLYGPINLRLFKQSYPPNAQVGSVGQNGLLVLELSLRFIGAPLHEADDYQGPREKQCDYGYGVVQAIFRHRDWRKCYAYLWGLVVLGFCVGAILGFDTRISAAWGICVLSCAVLLGELLLWVAYLLAPHAGS